LVVAEEVEEVAIPEDEERTPALAINRVNTGDPNRSFTRRKMGSLWFRPLVPTIEL
jgi:hypothetical protein